MTRSASINITRTGHPITNQPETIGEIRARGFDTEAKAELNPRFTLTAAYSYIDSEITEKRHQRHRRQPAVIRARTYGLGLGQLCDAGHGGCGRSGLPLRRWRYEARVFL
ncbi:hypothetical protein PE067_00255 [Paracoccus sp. DMF-8]|uniref:hypothetical protein n=1 Tax=Paracoccus sp. DMF-8 TaxID=3019445 RepID=UPI0023E8DCFE|nr:hypothetical protein [Paracoccus sp. DMF-8]MDF3604721.1 hypothetical protein [Paracoccus sp. DMF-8]